MHPPSLQIFLPFLTLTPLATAFPLSSLSSSSLLHRRSANPSPVSTQGQALLVHFPTDQDGAPSLPTFTIQDPNSVVGSGTCYWPTALVQAALEDEVTYGVGKMRSCEPETYFYQFESATNPGLFEITVSHTVTFPNPQTIYINGSTTTTTTATTVVKHLTLEYNSTAGSIGSGPQQGGGVGGGTLVILATSNTTSTTGFEYSHEGLVELAPAPKGWVGDGTK